MSITFYLSDKKITELNQEANQKTSKELKKQVAKGKAR